MISIDYRNRTIDLLVFRGAKAVGEAQLVSSLFDEEKSGEVCTGIQKLVQRWVVHFLTERGSMPYLPNQGTLFLAAARQGRLVLPSDVEAQFAFAAELVQDALAAETADTDPPDEVFVSATLDTVVLNSDNVELVVSITSAAGTSRSVVMPIDVVPFSTAVSQL